MKTLQKIEQYVEGVEVLRDWLGHGGVPVDREISQARANVCLKCVHNSLGNWPTKIIASAIKKHVELKNKMKMRVSGEKALKSCQICLCELRLKVHVPIGMIRKQMNEGELERFPDWCWQKKETE